MTGCENLCTADKCAELEERIKSLESILGVLQIAFDSHTNQDIPAAHDYKPVINLDVFEQENGEYVIKIQIDGESDQDRFSVTQIDDYVTQSEFQEHLNTDIPDAHGYQPPEYEPDLEITSFLTDE